MVAHSVVGLGEASLGNENLISKDNKQKLVKWQSSGEGRPRSDASSPSNFTSVLGSLDN